ncbi:hypothetical protein PM082_003830 [Marasmius tenuissimus]|nr:hypothetical protein PM082_003830 [Marasmius tenuissimus]
MLVGWTVDFTSDVLPHIRGLRTLKLRDQEQKGAYWDVLRSSDIHLRNITVCNPGSELVDYISSFSGLEILRLSVNRMIDQEESDRFARKFYEALPRHRATLKEATILSRRPELWISNASVFDGFTELVSLSVCVGRDDILATEDPEVNNAVGILVKHALALPKLRTIEINPTFHPRDAGGMSFIGTGPGIVGSIVENLKLTLKEPPLLTILIRGGRGKYIPEMISEGEVRYKFVSDP